MALGKLTDPGEAQFEGKFDLSSPEKVLWLYKAALQHREDYRKAAIVDPDQWRNVAYWTGMIDVFESMMTSKLAELVAED